MCPSTDIDGSPIVILSKEEAEEVLQVIDDSVYYSEPPFVHQPLYLKIMRALGVSNEPTA